MYCLRVGVLVEVSDHDVEETEQAEETRPRAVRRAAARTAAATAEEGKVDDSAQRLQP